MRSKKDYIIIFLIGILAGFLIVHQFYLAKQTKKIATGEDNQFLAVEVSQLIKVNSELRLEVKDLAQTEEKYQKSLEDRQSAQEELSKNLEKYKIIAGVTKVEGQGVEIKIEGDAGPENLVDLVNALRNIGGEGMAVNGIRFNLASYFKGTADGLFLGDTKITSPFLISAVGNAPVLKESLDRKGGIIEQIKGADRNWKISVEQKDKIILPAS